MNRDRLLSVVSDIKPVDKNLLFKAYNRIDNLTKPIKSLGYLEELAARFVAIRGEGFSIPLKKMSFVFAGDHKVTEEGVSAYPSEVTGLMVKNFVAGKAAINILTEQADSRLIVVDVGMAFDIGDLHGVEKRNVKHGSDNIAKGPAMSIDEVVQAITVGFDYAVDAYENNVDMIGTGEMGIGNTTPASALLVKYLGLSVEEMTGPGTGLNKDEVIHKQDVIRKALAINNTNCTDSLSTLAALGGLEIAAITGLCIGASFKRVPVVIDGFISTAAAVAAIKINPLIKDYLFFSHMSAEPGHKKFFEAEKIRPIIDLGMRLGEGTGSAIAMQIIQDAVAIYKGMATFEEAGIPVE